MTDSQFNTIVRLLHDTNTTLNARMDRIDNELSDVKTDLTNFKKNTETQFSSVRANITGLKAQMEKNNAINSKEHQDMINNMNSKFYDLEKTVKTIETDLNTVFVSNKYEHDLFKKKLTINI